MTSIGDESTQFDVEIHGVTMEELHFYPINSWHVSGISAATPLPSIFSAKPRNADKTFTDPIVFREDCLLQPALGKHAIHIHWGMKTVVQGPNWCRLDSVIQKGFS